MEIIMKAIIASVAAVAAVAALAAAVPASAQSWGGPFNGGGRFGAAGSARIDQRIELGLRNGSLTRTEATRLRRQLRDVQQREWRYARDGRVTASEARDLDRRYAALTMRLRVERRDNDRRGYGWGYGGGRRY
jgi:hypothetical protein